MKARSQNKMHTILLLFISIAINKEILQNDTNFIQNLNPTFMIKINSLFSNGWKSNVGKNTSVKIFPQRKLKKNIKPLKYAQIQIIWNKQE